MSPDERSNESRYDWRAKIRKLLALAGDPMTPPETREALMGKIAQLTAKIGLADSCSESGSTSVADRLIKLNEPHAEAKGILLQNIAVPLSCRSVLKRRFEPLQENAWEESAPRFRQAHIFGFDSDLDRVVILFESLLQQVESKWKAPHLDIFPQSRSLGIQYSKFLISFASEICRRLEEARRSVRQPIRQNRSAHRHPIESVLDERERRVVARMIEVYPNLATHPNKERGFMWDSSAAGQDAGRRADLGLSRIEGRKGG